MPPIIRNHLIIEGNTQTLPYTSNQLGRSKVIARTGINRGRHGASIKRQFENALSGFSDEEDPEFVYVVFRSPLDFLLDIQKLDKSNLRLANFKEVESQDRRGLTHRIVEATVGLNKKAIAAFLSKIDNYLNPEKDTKKGNPANHPLISNIDQVRAATLESFWQEPEIPFPDPNTITWWEVWLSRSPLENLEDPLADIRDDLIQNDILISQRTLKFPEHYVFLMRGTGQALADTILYSDKLAEIRKPKETAEFFMYLDRQDQNNWIEDLLNRVQNNQAGSNISVCLLDTGVNIANPLLSNLIPPQNLDTVEPAWGTNDGEPNGHGTPMAGLGLFGDLVDIMGNAGIVPINYQLESVKLINRAQPHDPDLYGAVTQEAISRREVVNPALKRMVCMAITSSRIEYQGRPSSWSSAVDQILFGAVGNLNNQLLFFISSGNLGLAERINYPLENDDCSIEDPAQSFNSITVGGYTLKDTLDLELFPGAELLAQRGGMSPCNTTSISWEKEWSRKPDIVMEAGNQAIQNGGTIDPDSLQLLATAKGGGGRPWLTTFSDTSASTALASKFAAELYTQYPGLWPESIRGLIVHSADWTDQMLGNRSIAQLSVDEKTKLLSTVGYGVPNMQRARYSMNNSLSYVIERTLNPFIKEDSRIKTNQFHFFELPWPLDVLQELLETEVNFKITLSYFIEPNPGNKEYEKAASYRSHGLRFKMIDSNESPAMFLARVSKAMREEGYEAEGGEHWVLGNKLRDKGSLHKDIWIGTAADLATRNKIAVYPVGGWWKLRPKHERYTASVRYSLILTIDTPSNQTDILTPVFNQVGIPIEILP